MQPVLSKPCYEENQINRLNSQAQTVPVIADGQAKLYASRAVRLFSTQTKCEDSAPLRGPPVTPQAWSGLASFRVMGSFKKLRTSVLQGIQSRSNAMAAGQERNPSSTFEDGGSFLVTKREVATNQIQETDKVSNGTAQTGKTSSVLDEDDCEEDLSGFQRNSHFSQSIRKAYGAGRISLLDTVKTESPSNSEPDPRKNVKGLKRLSKSADNLHVFKSHFRRKAEPQNPECPSTIFLQRTNSSSLVDLQEHGSGRRQSPMRTRGHLQKLVGSLTDLSVKRKNTPGPVSRKPLSPLSQLHDDYSRRTPCVPMSGRQQRPSPIPSKAQQANTHQHTPILHPAPSCPASSDITKAFLKSDEISAAAASPVTNTCSSQSPLVTPTTPISPPFASDSSSSVVPRKRAGRSRPRPVSDYGQLASSKYCIPEEDRESETMDYTSQKDYNSNGSYTESHRPENGHVCTQTESRKRRPISVIGGVDLYSSPTTDLICHALFQPTSRPPVPSHRVPPYRAVSARLRPCVFSQSTPIGLDRMGRRKGRRVLSDGSSDPMLDDSVSEEDGSFEELTEGTPYLQPEVELFTLNQYIQSGHAVYAEALWDHVTMEEQELAFKAGDVIRVLDVQEQDWWWGAVGDHEAWFPSSFVRVRVNQEDSSSDSVEIPPDAEESVPPDTHKQNSEHRQQMRANVVKEIMDTERVYIKHLKDICEGYIRQCRKHPGMFTDAQLKTIFSNIEDIYRFQRKFLKDLEKKYNPENPHLSEIGSCFLQQEDGFSIYSEYCNTHPVACAELQRLMKQGRYKHFFEACRLLQQMIDISIAGFLLTPVQKICKYPLQLGELLKYTPKDHSDYAGVCAAHKAMKNVASLINERKRRLESIDTIAHWQVAILHWAGEDVLMRSSELIHSGELTRIVRPGKTQQRSYFLFDHQLVFCKKDVLRRDLLHYRDRMDTDLLEPIDLPDGRHAELGLLKNAFLLRHAENLNVLCVLCCKKSQDKQRWLQAFARERRRVQEDQEMGIEITEAQRKQAVHNARKTKQGNMKKTNYSDHPVPPHHQPLHPLHQRHVTVPTSIPQQQVFSLAEPKKKPSHLLYSLARSALFRK
uniref:Spermatogenesis-associated protein 13-like n=1 Tax=Sinocyclocheilus grahami TaxID=75366 RepID=A0A672N7N7_SINGR